MKDYPLLEEIARMANVMESGEVRRFHAAPSVPAQTVGHHAWGVAVLATFIKVDPRPDFIIHALCHDMAELFTGDVPFTAKRESALLESTLDMLEGDVYAKRMFHLPRITQAEKAVLKFCDMLEGLRWAVTYETPNPRSRECVVAERWFAALLDMLKNPHVMKQLLTEERDRIHALLRRFSGAAMSDVLTVADLPVAPETPSQETCPRV